jgi:hypothetical protein
MTKAKEQPATMADAREILKAARGEAKNRGRGLKTRQAAEKVWLAASTAAAAMAGGEEIGLSTHVFRLFERAWGAKGRQVAKDIEAALHRGCFYRNAAACDGEYVGVHAARLGRLLHTPIRDRAIQAAIARKNGG